MNLTLAAIQQLYQVARDENNRLRDLYATARLLQGRRKEHTL